MLRTILCEDCGHVMSRFRNSCSVCSRTNLSFYTTPDSPELQAKLRQLNAKKRHDIWTRLMCAGLLVALVVVLGYDIVHRTHVHAAVASKTTETATAPSSNEKAVQTAASGNSLAR